MKKKLKSGLPAVRVDPYLEGLMSKLLDRLMSLEKKMDTVIAQTSGTAAATQSAPIKQAPRRDRVLYEAVCADCHKVCEVPFRPSEDRAVYCKECFAKRKSGQVNKPYPILTPVAMPAKPPVLREPSPKAKKGAPAKKIKSIKKMRSSKKEPVEKLMERLRGGRYRSLKS